MGFSLEAIPGSRLSWLNFNVNEDERGWLAEIYNQERATALGLGVFAQDNLSLTLTAGRVRGLHYQRPPCAQAKLVRVVRGAIFNVAVDLAAAAPSPEGCVIAEGEPRWLHLPQGFAHGFQSLADRTELAWKLSGPFAPDHAGGVAFDDPTLKISWPLPVDRAALSARDRAAGPLGPAHAHFRSAGSAPP